MNTVRYLTLLALLAIGNLVAVAEQPTHLTLRVEPQNQTADAPGVGAGLAVAVDQHSREDGEQVTTKAVTGDDGRAVLELDLAHGTHFNVEVEYQGVAFKRHIVWEGGEPELNVPLDIYEPTRSASGLRALQHHVLLAPAEGELRVREIIVIEQTQKQVYIGQEGAPGEAVTLAFSLPEGFQDLHVSSHGTTFAMQQAEGRISATAPVMPGKTVFDLEYMVPLGNKAIPFSKAILYPTERYLVMMGRGAYELSSRELIVKEETMQDGVTLQTVLCEEVAAGQTVSVIVQPGTGAAPAAAPLHATNASYLATSWLWPLAGGALVLVVLFFGLKRQGAAVPAKAGGPDVASFLEAQLAELESAYRDNQVTRQYYGSARDQLREQLDRLTSKTSKGD